MKPIIGITTDIDGNRSYLRLEYIDFVKNVGGIPLLITPTSVEDVMAIVDTIDGLLLSGGDDIHPSYYGEEITAELKLTSNARTDFEIALLNEAIRARKPLLGICYGMQLMNIVTGGTLYQDIEKHRESRHTVNIYSNTKLYDIVKVDVTDVNSTHHQSVKVVGKNIVVTAVAPDGIVEAIELQNYPFFIGVQWHPERNPEDLSTMALASAFIEISRKRINQR
ncbi:MAG: gamma-glutamyl-gamma-aminobutyrate hydrolase family protein, partial [Nitrospirota bacterium]